MTTDTVDSSPINLPAGSYDMDALQKLTDRAAAAKTPETRAKLLAQIEDLRISSGPATDPAGQKGFRSETVKREIAPGVFVTETISVFDPKLVEGEVAVAAQPKETGAAKGAAQEGSN